MYELFNPAGLRLVEDKNGAISYGWIAPRVLYARFVGALSAELGTTFVRQLEALVDDVPALAYFGDASALSQYDVLARLRFQRFVATQRAKFAALVTLTWAHRNRRAARSFPGELDEIARFVADPDEFERELSNVAPLPTPQGLAPTTHLPRFAGGRVTSVGSEQPDATLAATAARRGSDEQRALPPATRRPLHLSVTAAAFHGAGCCTIGSGRR